METSSSTGKEFWGLGETKKKVVILENMIYYVHNCCVI